MKSWQSTSKWGHFFRKCVKKKKINGFVFGPVAEKSFRLDPSMLN